MRDEYNWGPSYNVLFIASTCGGRRLPITHNDFVCILANNLEFLEGVESLVLSWIKQIEQVLAQSEQVSYIGCDARVALRSEVFTKKSEQFIWN